MEDICDGNQSNQEAKQEEIKCEYVVRFQEANIIEIKIKK